MKKSIIVLFITLTFQCLSCRLHAQSDSVSYIHDLMEILEITQQPSDKTRDQITKSLQSFMRKIPQMFGYSLILEKATEPLASNIVNRYYNESYPYDIAKVLYADLHNDISHEQLVTLKNILQDKNASSAFKNYQVCINDDAIKLYRQSFNKWFKENANDIFNGRVKYVPDAQSYRVAFSKLFPLLPFSEEVKEVAKDLERQLRKDGLLPKGQKDYSNLLQAMNACGIDLASHMCSQVITIDEVKILQTALSHSAMKQILKSRLKYTEFDKGEGWCILHFDDKETDNEYHQLLLQTVNILGIDINQASKIISYSDVSDYIERACNQDDAKQAFESYLNNQIPHDYLSLYVEPSLPKSLTLQDLKDIQEILSDSSLLTALRHSRICQEKIDAFIRENISSIMHGTTIKVNAVKCPKNYQKAFSDYYSATTATQMTNHITTLLTFEYGTKLQDVSNYMRFFKQVGNYLDQNLKNIVMNNWCETITQDEIVMLTQLNQNEKFGILYNILVENLSPRVLNTKVERLWGKAMGYTLYMADDMKIFVPQKNEMK